MRILTFALISDKFIKMPEIEEIYLPLLTIIPLQLLAYYVAMYKGNHIDRPKNISKSLTVK